MIELTFKLNLEDGAQRDVHVRLHEPTRNPPEDKWPWAIKVDLDGRPFTTYGMDPIDAVETGARHAAIVLHELHGDALEPPIEQRKW